MTRPAVTLALPGRRDGAWTDTLLDALAPAAARIADRLGLPAPTLVVLRTDDDPALILGTGRLPLPDLDRPLRLAAAFEVMLEQQASQAWLLEAIAARGLPAQGFWLAHAASRGLGLDALAGLAEGGAGEDAIAWRLAERFPPTLRLLISPEAPREGTDARALREAASRAAAWSGIPIPVPELGPPDAGVEEGATMLALGSQRVRMTSAAALDEMLLLLAAAVVDPALVLAVCGNETRLPRRLAVRALAGNGAVRLAEAIVREHRERRWPVDLVPLAEHVAGLAPAQ
jgi:hypothetical protein